MVGHLCPNISKRGNPSRSPSLQTKLLTLLKERNVENFVEELENGLQCGQVDINYHYEYPDHGTMLHIACRSKGLHKFVEILLKNGADINKPNSKEFARTAIHFAVDSGDLETLRILLNDPKCNVNCLTLRGNSALHYAAEHDDVEAIKLLLEHPAIDVNIGNRTDRSPLHLALNQNRRKAIHELLEHPEVDLDSRRDIHGHTCRQLIESSYPEFHLKIPQVGLLGDTDDGLFSLLHKRNVDKFRELVGISKLNSTDHDGKYTYLQYACNYGMLEVVEVLLKAGVDPNSYCPNNPCTPTMIAAERGYHTILEILLQESAILFEPVAGKTPLNSLFDGMLAIKNQLVRVKPECDHFKCLELLLMNKFRSKLDINYPDKDGNTPLHYAIKVNNEDTIRALLHAGAYVGRANNLGKIPLKTIRASLLEKCLDDCISTNAKHPRDEDYEIIFDYSMITHPKLKESAGEEVINDLTEMDVLLTMNKTSELRKLLKHPVLLSFLNLKWHTIAKYFYINLIFYFIFCILLTSYICYINGCFSDYNNTQLLNSSYNCPNNDQNSTLFLETPVNCSGDQIGSQQFPQDSPNVIELMTNHNISKVGVSLWYIMLVLCIILIFRELYQFYAYPWRYLKSTENWLEIGLICTTLTLLLCQMSFEQRRQLSSAAIMVSWADLMLLIGRHPLSSTNVEMFKTVSINFLKFLAWYSILILAFALSFYILFKDDPQDSNRFFRDPALAIIKSIVMLTGEFEAGSIPLFPFNPKSSATYVLFILFVFLIAIVLFNLLNGLAVSDTQAIRSDAELVGIVSRVKLISYVETIAVADPFKCLNFVHMIARYCTLVPYTQARRRRHKHIRIFYENANLFPYLFLESKIRVRPNDNNIVFLKKFGPATPQKSTFFKGTTIIRYFCRIDSHIMKDAVKILERNNQQKAIDEECIYQKLSEYDSRMGAIEKLLLEYNSKLGTIDKSLKDIMEILNLK